MQNNISMDSKDEALLKTLEMRDTINDDFCGKLKWLHLFTQRIQSYSELK